MKGADVVLVALIQMASFSAGYPAGQKIKTKPQTVTPNAERVWFRCSPHTVGPDSTVTLTATVPHGPELGVRTPDNRFLFIAFVQETKDSVPPVAGETFRKMASLPLKVADAKGLASIGSSDYLTIFTTPGTYQFVLADNLETEAEFGGHKTCEVQFVPAK